MDNDIPGPAPSAQPAAAPPQIIIQQTSSMFGRFGKWLLLFLFIAVMIIFSLIGSYQSYFSTQDGPQEKYHSLSTVATDKVAIIDVNGAILEGDGIVKKQIDRVKDDDSVIAVVLRINSPGGTVTGSDYLLHHLRELKDERDLPLVVSMGSICASGGYYIAMAVGDQEEAVFAEPTTWTGSIGVIIPHYDLSGLMGFLNIQDDSIASGPYKQMGSPTKEMTDEERDILQQLVDESFTGFKDVVAYGRPALGADPQAMDDIATGQIFTASQALELGMIDKIGFIEAAIERAVVLAGRTTDDVRCVRYYKPPSFFDELMGADTQVPHDGLDLASVLDLATPRAYYLWTWLPSLSSNSQP